MPISRAPKFEAFRESLRILEAECSYDDCYQMVGSRGIDVELRADACIAW